MKTPSKRPGRTDRGTFSIDASKVIADTTAEERFVSRSFKYQKRLRLWLSETVRMPLEDRRWKSIRAMARDAANYCGSSMQWAERWLYQFTGPGQEWQMGEDEEAEWLYLVPARVDPEAVPTFEEEKAKEKVRT